MGRKWRKRKLGAIRACVCLVTLCLVILGLTGIEKLVDLGFGDVFAAEADIEPETETETEIETEEEVTPETESETETETVTAPIMKVCVDAGHGGKDGGADDGMGRLEKDDVLRLALLVRDELAARNAEVIMTREDDTFVELSERAAIANRAGVDYFVSLHRNTGEGNGVEIWIHSSADENSDAFKYGSNIMSGLETVGITRNRGVKNGSQSSSDSNLLVNRETEMTSSLIEMGFMNYGEDNQFFDAHLQEYAAAIADGIVNTYKELHPELLAPEAAPASTITGEGSTDPNGNVTSIHIENTPVDVSSLSSALVEWGSGGPVDSLNRPDGCIIDQEKYGHLSSYFIAPMADENDKVVYLTFDIGYTNEYTTSILDTLKEKDVKGVFFATLPVVNEDTEICTRIINEGHELGNHSVSHTNMAAKSVEEQQSELMQVHEATLANYGYEMHLWRYPEGKFSEQGLGIVNNCNYRSVFWSFAHKDWNTDDQPSVSDSLAKCVNSLHPGAIYLLHGISSTNAALLGDFIDQARAQGYRFELLQ